MLSLVYCCSYVDLAHVHLCHRSFSLSLFSLLYPKHKVKIIVSLCIASWLLALIVHTISLPFGLDCYKFRPVLWLCGLSSDCNPLCAQYTSLIYSVLAAPAAIIPLFLYIILYIKAKRIQRAIESVEVTEYRQRERKAFFLLFITVFAFNLPSVTVAVVVDRLYFVSEVPAALFVVMTFTGVLVSALIITDPIVMMRHRDISDIIKTLWNQKCRFSIKRNK